VAKLLRWDGERSERRALRKGMGLYVVISLSSAGGDRVEGLLVQ
jgi:hypothetical protein